MLARSAARSKDYEKNNKDLIREINTLTSFPLCKEKERGRRRKERKCVILFNKNPARMIKKVSLSELNVNVCKRQIHFCEDNISPPRAHTLGAFLRIVKKIPRWCRGNRGFRARAYILFIITFRDRARAHGRMREREREDETRKNRGVWSSPFAPSPVLPPKKTTIRYNRSLDGARDGGTENPDVSSVRSSRATDGERTALNRARRGGGGGETAWTNLNFPSRQTRRN